MKSLRYILWALVAAAAIGFATLYLRSARPVGESIGVTPMPELGGSFVLTGTDGKPFGSQDLAGKPYAIFFGFTNCPDVCPTTLSRLARLRRQTGSDDAFSIVLVTVDPERDTPAALRDYVQLFDSPVIALTGSPGAIETVKKKFGIFSQKASSDSGSYTVDHTATVILFDRNGKFQSTIAADEGDASALDKLKRLTGNS